MARNGEREYRSMAAPLAAPLDALLGKGNRKRIDSSYYIEGYAATFARYLLYEWDGVQYFEEISPDALAGADMSDVIMQYDHRGKVLARLSNGTLGIEADHKGLFVFADLSKSSAAKEMYEEISAGLVTKMSWAFSIADETYDEDSRVFLVNRIKKVYDVSAVSIPANGDTDISARGLERRSFVTSREKRPGLGATRLGLKIKMSLGAR